MGCQQSSPAVPDRHLTTVGKSTHSKRPVQDPLKLTSRSREEKQKDMENGPRLNEQGQLMPDEVAKRTTNSKVVSSVTTGNKEKGSLVRVRYAYWSQCGFYPDDPMKANQDSLSVTKQFAGESGDMLFVVYDGHGAVGHHCAEFAENNLPKIMAKTVRQKRVKSFQDDLKASGKSTKGSFKPDLWPQLSTAHYEAACKKSFDECNTKMHQAEDVLDKLSGTTAVAAAFHFGRLTVCNTGDSRAVLGHRMADDGNSEEEKDESNGGAADKGKLVALPLSYDQTPFRKDERERVRKAGASILTVAQMEGESPAEECEQDWDDKIAGKAVIVDGDVPRLWVPGKDYPGCAFTRSIGDSLGDTIGIIAEPEVITTELTSRDEILVLGSDGVFDFLTNQMVIDLCAECADPLEACEKVVKASYDQWLENDERTDDITLIVCFLECDQEPAKNVAGTTAELLANYDLKTMHPTHLFPQ